MPTVQDIEEDLASGHITDQEALDGLKELGIGEEEAQNIINDVHALRDEDEDEFSTDQDEEDEDA